MDIAVETAASGEDALGWSELPGLFSIASGSLQRTYREPLGYIRWRPIADVSASFTLSVRGRRRPGEPAVVIEETTLAGDR